MKILLSAYACEPNKGSEPGVGWNWAINLTKLGHDVTVLTRKNNKSSINKMIKKNKLKSIKFEYYDLPNWLIFIKKKCNFFIIIYYYLWQYFSYLEYKEKVLKYDIIHHLTFGTLRVPSFFWKTKIPLIYGPVGGVETTPLFLIKDMKLNHKIKEYSRYLINYLQIKFDFNLKKCLKNSNFVFARTLESKNYMKKITAKNIPIIHDVGCDKIYHKKKKFKKITNFLFAGRHVYWKGGELIILAFSKALQKNKNIRLNFVGDGPEKNKWRSLSISLKLEKYIKFYSWMSKEKIINFYQNNDVLIFPSFHDTGGSVVNEAMSYSLPIICFNLGGPNVRVDNTNGVLINVKKKNLSKIIITNKIKNAIMQLSKDRNKIQKLTKGAFSKSKKFRWHRLIKNTYKYIN